MEIPLPRARLKPMPQPMLMMSALLNTTPVSTLTWTHTQERVAARLRNTGLASFWRNL
jgi:hypothetical protein